MNKTKLLIFVLLLLTMLRPVDTQRGGGGMRARRSSGYRRPPMPRGAFKMDNRPGNPSQNQSYLIFLAMLVFCLFQAYTRYRQPLLIWQQMQHFKQNCKKQPCTLNQDEKHQMISTFRAFDYNMKIAINNHKNDLVCSVKMISLIQESPSQYAVKFRGRDQIGLCSMQGYVIFTGNLMAVKLVKKYQDANQSGQTGSFQTLFYQGKQLGIYRVAYDGRIPIIFEGKWAYYGYQNNPQYSGTWAIK